MHSAKKLVKVGQTWEAYLSKSAACVRLGSAAATTVAAPPIVAWPATAAEPHPATSRAGAKYSSSGPIDAFGATSHRFKNVCVTYNMGNKIEFVERALIYFTGDTSAASVAEYVQSRQCVPCVNPQMTTQWNEYLDKDYPHNDHPIAGKACGQHWLHEVRAPTIDALSQCWANNAKEIAARGQSQSSQTAAAGAGLSAADAVTHSGTTLLVQFYRGNIGHQIFDSVLAMGGVLTAMLESVSRAETGEASPSTMSAGDALPPTFNLMIHQDPDCSGTSFVCYILKVLGMVRSGGHATAAHSFALLPFDAEKKTLHCFEDLVAPKYGLGRVQGGKVNPVVLRSFIARLRAVLAAEHADGARALSGAAAIATSASKAPRWVIYGREDAKRRRWTNSKDVVAELRTAFAAAGEATRAVAVTYVPTMGGLSFKAQMELFVSATVFLAPHGAHMGNSIFFGDGTVVRELSCTGYSHLAIYPGLTKALAIDFVSQTLKQSVCVDTGGEQGLLDADFTVTSSEVWSSVEKSIGALQREALSLSALFGGGVGADKSKTAQDKSKARLTGGEATAATATAQRRVAAGPTCASIAYPFCAKRAHLPTSVAECEFDMDTDREYLPSAALLACFEKEPALLQKWRDDAKGLYARAETLQSPESCSHPLSADHTVPSWTLGPKSEALPGPSGGTSGGDGKWHLVRWYPHGHGYNLFMMVWNIGNHWDRGVPVMIGESRYRLGDECGAGWSCYLRPLSNCTVTNTPLSSILVYNFRSPQTALSLAQVCKPHGRYLRGRCLCDSGYVAQERRGWPFCMPIAAVAADDHWLLNAAQVYASNPAATIDTDILWNTMAPGESNPQATVDPVHFPVPAGTSLGFGSGLKKEHGFFWWHAHTSWFLHKDSPERPKLDAYVASLTLRRDCIAVHIRHGDSCHDSTKPYRKCFAVPQYVEAIRRVAAKYPPAGGMKQQLFVASDDEKALLELNATYGAEFDLVWQKSALRVQYDSKQGLDGRLELNTPAFAKEIYRDLWALGSCHAYVGTFSSAIGWAAYGRMTVQRGMYRPFVSLDLALADGKYLGKFVKRNSNDGTR